MPGGIRLDWTSGAGEMDSGRFGGAGSSIIRSLADGCNGTGDAGTDSMERCGEGVHGGKALLGTVGSICIIGDGVSCDGISG